MDIIHSDVLTPVIAIALCNFFFFICYVKLKLLYWAPASHTLSLKKTAFKNVCIPSILSVPTLNGRSSRTTVYPSPCLAEVL